MRQSNLRRRPGLRVAIVLLLSLGLSLGALADDREFSGKIVKVNNKRVVVDSPHGDEVRFKRIKTTEVFDRRPPRLRHSPREEWADLRKGDSVAVEWRLADKPRKAYRIVVLPPRKGSED